MTSSHILFLEDWAATYDGRKLRIFGGAGVATPINFIEGKCFAWFSGARWEIWKRKKIEVGAPGLKLSVVHHNQWQDLYTFSFESDLALSDEVTTLSANIRIITKADGHSKLLKLRKLAITRQ